MSAARLGAITYNRKRPTRQNEQCPNTASMVIPRAILCVTSPRLMIVVTFRFR